MVKAAGLAMEFYFQGFDLSGDIASIENMGSPRTTFPVTGINKSSMERVHGRFDAVLDFTSWFNKAAGQQHLALRTLPTTDVDVLVALQGGAKGSSIGFMGDGKQPNFSHSRGADGSLTSKGNMMANGKAWEYGTMLLAKVTICATGNSVAEDNLASTSAGLAGIIHVTGFTGTDYTATIQDSSCGTCFCTLKAFAQITAINKSERVTVSGTVNRHMRINHAGTFCSITVVVGTRRGDATDKEGY